MLHSSLVWTWKWPVLSCVCLWRFMLLLFGNNTWVEHNWKANFLFDFSPGSQLFWRVVRSNASLWDIFFCFDGRLVSLPQVLCNVACSALDDSHHRKTCSTPLWSWRGRELFSPVSESAVVCLWCLGITHGSNIIERLIFCSIFLPVHSCFGVL